MKIKTHAYPFDPTYGFDADALSTITPPEGPADFDDFWQSTWRANEESPLNLEVRAVAAPASSHLLYEMNFTVLDGVRVGAWLVMPAGGHITAAAVVGHGYGGRDAPDYPARSAAYLFFCAPGFNRSKAGGLPGEAWQHVVHGIQHRESYLIRHCVCAIWSSARALQTFLDRSIPELYYIGGSFGGGLGALAMPYDERFKKCVLIVPTFGNHPVRLQCRCHGSGEAVRQYAQEHPEVIDVLRYYDAGTAALRIRMPNVTAPALFDPAVPPPGQFSVSNPLRRYGRQYILSAGHHVYEDSAREDAELNQWVEEDIWNI